MLRKLMVATFFIYLTVSTASADTILGRWVTAGEESTVDLFPCGNKICGKIVDLKDDRYTNPDYGPVGTLKTDLQNPDPSKRNIPLLGLHLLKGLTQNGKNTWINGIIYDPESGYTYRCKAELSEGKLEVRGYLGISMFGRTTTWTRQ